MSHHNMSLMRRRLLQASMVLGAGVAAPMFGQLAQFANAAAGEDYRALVCLFMYGGNDGNNMVLPYDTADWTLYQRARGGIALNRDTVLQIAPNNTASRKFALHPAMAGIQNLFNTGKAAVVANVGPLLAPTTKADYEQRKVPLPDNLFSHSDQQQQWQTAISDGPGRTGWAGRMLEAGPGSLNTANGYSMLSVAGSTTWGNGTNLAAYKVSPSGNFGFDFYDASRGDPLSAGVAQVLKQSRTDLFEQSWLDVIGRSLENQRILQSALQGKAVSTVFPNSGIGNQMRMIARLISARQALGIKRQCFFCSIGGFDTHGDDQLQRQQELLGEISAAIAAFYAATVELGVAEQVTTFTASDFGRQFVTNGKGSDHGWGNHQFVIGGSVKGGAMYGKYPDLVIGGQTDAGQGSWIPSISVDSVAGTLGAWFGLNSAQADAVLPNLKRFERNLGFMA